MQSRKATLVFVLSSTFLATALAFIFEMLPKWVGEHFKGNKVITDMPTFSLWIAIFLAIACTYGIIWALDERVKVKYNSQKESRKTAVGQNEVFNGIQAMDTEKMRLLFDGTSKLNPEQILALFWGKKGEQKDGEGSKEAK